MDDVEGDFITVVLRFVSSETEPVAAAVVAVDADDADDDDGRALIFRRCRCRCNRCSRVSVGALSAPPMT